MGSNDFDEDVMPSARAARARDRRQLGALPIYLGLAALLGAAILGIVFFGGSREGRRPRWSSRRAFRWRASATRTRAFRPMRSESWMA